MTEGDVLERTLEDGFAYGSDGGLEFLHPRIGGDPPAHDVEFRYPAIVAIEEGDEIFRDVALVLEGEGPHDAEIDGNVGGILGGRDGNEDVSGMHVGMEEVVSKDLGEEDLDAAFGQNLEIDAATLEGFPVTDGNARNAFHDHDVPARLGPIYSGNVEVVGILEIAPQLGGGGAFPQEVEFVQDGLFVFGDHLSRTQPASGAPIALGKFGEGIEQTDIALDDAPDVGTKDLDDHLPTIREARGMDLGNGGGSDGRFVEYGEDLAQGMTIGLFDEKPRLVSRKGRHAILELGEFFGDVSGQKVAPGGKDLPELDEDGPKVLEGHSQPHRARRAGFSPPIPGKEVKQKSDGAKEMGREDDFVQAVPHQYDIDVNEPEGLTDAVHGKTSIPWGLPFPIPRPRRKALLLCMVNGRVLSDTASKSPPRKAARTSSSSRASCGNQ